MDIELSDQDVERLQLLAKMKGVAVEDVVIEAISEYLGQLEGVVAGLDIQQALVEADAGDFAQDGEVDLFFSRLKASLQQAVEIKEGRLLPSRITAVQVKKTSSQIKAVPEGGKAIEQALPQQELERKKKGKPDN